MNEPAGKPPAGGDSSTDDRHTLGPGAPSTLRGLDITQFRVRRVADENTSGYGRIRCVMDSVTLRLKENTVKSLDKEANVNDVSRSEHIRNIIRSRHDHEDIRTEYEEKISEYEDQIDELRDDLEEKQATITDLRREVEIKEDTIAELEERIANLERDRDRELAERERRIRDLKRERDRLQNEKRLILEQRDETTDLVRTAERQQDWIEKQAKAGLVRKAKWALFGMPDDENEE